MPIETLQAERCNRRHRCPTGQRPTRRQRHARRIPSAALSLRGQRARQRNGGRGSQSGPFAEKSGGGAPLPASAKRRQALGGLQPFEQAALAGQHHQGAGEGGQADRQGAQRARRFKQRQEITYKRFKITEEDWRNRKKWPAYERAVEDTLSRTSSDLAPWHVVASNDKLFSRIEVLERLVERLEA